MGTGGKGESELSTGDGDEICEAGSVGWDHAEHGGCGDRVVRWFGRERDSRCVS